MTWSALLQTAPLAWELVKDCLPTEKAAKAAAVNAAKQKGERSVRSRSCLKASLSTGYSRPPTCRGAEHAGQNTAAIWASRPSWARERPAEDRGVRNGRKLIYADYLVTAELSKIDSGRDPVKPESQFAGLSPQS